MSIDLYKCTNEKCSLYNTPTAYEYTWLGVRPVCSDCKEAPSLENTKVTVSINTYGCTPTSKRFTH